MFTPICNGTRHWVLWDWIRVTGSNGYGFQHTLAVARAEEVLETVNLVTGELIDGVEDVCRTYCLMMLGRVMLGWIIGQVEMGTLPVDSDLFLDVAVLEPIEAHIHGFRAALGHGFGEDTNGGLIVELQGSGALGVA